MSDLNNRYQLRPWRLSGLLTNSRTVGNVQLSKNGSFLDIWIRIDGEPRWFAVLLKDVNEFLDGPEQVVTLHAESDANAELEA